MVGDGGKGFACPSNTGKGGTMASWGDNSESDLRLSIQEETSVLDFTDWPRRNELKRPPIALVLGVTGVDTMGDDIGSSTCGVFGFEGKDEFATLSEIGKKV